MTKLVFGYFGGKASKLNWLLPLLTPPTPEKLYCEPFCGSCAVALNREHSAQASRSRVTLSDIDGQVINFFKVLRDQPDEIIRRISLTPRHRGEYQYAVDNLDSDLLKTDQIESARLFFVLIHQSFSGMYKQGGKTNYGGVSKPIIESEVRGKLSEVSEALQRFRFETKDALDCIKQYGVENALLYLDPPYRFESRVEAQGYYRCDDFDDKHEEMLMLAKRSKAFIRHFRLRDRTL